MSSITRSHIQPFKLLAGTAAVALLIGWSAGASAQNYVFVPQQQASTPAATAPPSPAPAPFGEGNLPKGQNKLIALAYDPGRAAAQIAPASTAAVQQYDQKHG